MFLFLLDFFGGPLREQSREFTMTKVPVFALGDYAFKTKLFDLLEDELEVGVERSWQMNEVILREYLPEELLPFRERLVQQRSTIEVEQIGAACALQAIESGSPLVIQCNDFAIGGEGLGPLPAKRLEQVGEMKKGATSLCCLMAIQR